jgi:ATP-dependent RNA helicase DDX20
MAAAAFEVPAALTTSESTMAAERAAAPVQAVEPTPASPWTQRTAHDIGGPRTRTGDVVLAEPADFESLLLSRPVLEGLRAAGFERPSPVQLKAIPLGRCGLGEDRGRPAVGGRRGRRGPRRAPAPRHRGAKPGSKARS